VRTAIVGIVLTSHVARRKVACFVSNPNLEKRKYSCQISTKQVAPTILKALGYNPKELQGVVAEDTEVLTGF